MIDYEITLAPAQTDIDAALNNIIAAELRAARDSAYQPFGIRLMQDGKLAGGLTGYALFDWLFIQFIGVPQDLQGQGIGRELMNRAEAWAREQGLIGMWLDTFEFQARGFYEKLGFSIFGTIEDHPVGSRRFFLQKRFEAPTA
jgi:GNAT superfamily N-acetyltransferase